MPFSTLGSRPLLAREDDIRKHLSLEPFHYLSTCLFIQRVEGVRSQETPGALWIFVHEVACRFTTGFDLEACITRCQCSGIGTHELASGVLVGVCANLEVVARGSTR